MSQYSSFTSEGIIFEPDYEVLRDYAGKYGNSKFLAFAPPAKYTVGDKEYEALIIQGKIGSSSFGGEYLELMRFLWAAEKDGMKVKYPVSFLIFPEGHDSASSPEAIKKLTYFPDGEIEDVDLCVK